MNISLHICLSQILIKQQQNRERVRKIQKKRRTVSQVAATKLARNKKFREGQGQIASIRQKRFLLSLQQPPRSYVEIH